MFSDITDRVRAERALRESEEKLQAVFDAIANGVVEYNAAGVPVRANPAAVAIMGVNPVHRGRGELARELLMRHPDASSPSGGGRPVEPDDLPSSRALRGERVVAQPLACTRASGEHVFILSSATPLFDGDGVSGAVVVWHDITERQALEEALRVQAREQTILEERQRLARDLHDAVSQTLFSASLIADVLPRLWERDPELVRPRLEELKGLTRGARAEMRTLLWELRPETLLQVKLDHLLQQLAEAVGARVPIQITMTTQDGGCVLPGDVQVGLYRIVQEALNNVVKHSRAEHVSIDLGCQPGAGGVVVSIKDDGRGFDAQSRPDGMGLRIMRERAQAIGAEVTINSQVSAFGQSTGTSGTQVKVVWPAPGKRSLTTGSG